MLPPVRLAYVANAIGPVTVDAVINSINDYASRFLTDKIIEDTRSIQ